MRLTAAVLATILLLACSALAQPPGEFVLHQNEPDPFCLEVFPNGTAIRFELPQNAHVRLEVSSPDTTSVVRTLIDGNLITGYHEVIWDGRDTLGEVVEDGAYPYTMTAAEAPGGPVLYEETLVATVSCGSPVDEITWGCIKAVYRRTDRPAHN